MTDLLDVFTQSATKPTVMCDVDNTLAWTMNHTLGMLNARFGTNMVLADVTVYHFAANLPLEQSIWVKQQYERSITYATVPPDYHAIDAINALHDQGFHVVVATSRASQMRSVTVNWLSEWGVKYDEVIVGPTVKVDYVRTHPGRLLAIDDDPATALSLTPLGAEVMIPDRTYTPAWCRSSKISGVQVFTDWGEVLKRLT